MSDDIYQMQRNELQYEVERLRAELHALAKERDAIRCDRAQYAEAYENALAELAAARAERDKEIDARLAVFRENDELRAEIAAEREKVEQAKARWRESAVQADWVAQNHPSATERVAARSMEMALRACADELSPEEDRLAAIDAALQETGGEP